MTYTEPDVKRRQRHFNRVCLKVGKLKLRGTGPHVEDGSAAVDSPHCRRGGKYDVA